MPNVTLDVPQEIWDLAARTGANPKETVGKLALASLREWADWMRGTRRPMSVSEIELDRLFSIYDQILVDRLPSIDHLAELLDLPMGRARYIMQSMAYRHGAFLRRRQLQAVVQALKMGQWSKDRASCAVTVDRSCQALMDRTLAELSGAGRIATTVTGTVIRAGVRYVMGANHHAELLKEFTALLDAPERGG